MANQNSPSRDARKTKPPLYGIRWARRSTRSVTCQLDPRSELVNNRTSAGWSAGLAAGTVKGIENTVCRVKIGAGKSLIGAARNVSSALNASQSAKRIAEYRIGQSRWDRS